MDARARIATGGVFAGAAVVGVLAVVAMSNTAALADVPGTVAGVSPVRVAAAATSPSATPSATETPATVIPAPVPTTETVPAPPPADIANAVTSAPTVSADATAPSQEESLAAGELRFSSWDSARRWAAERGWSQARIDRWIAVLQAKVAQNERTQKTSTDTSVAQTPAHAGNTSGSEQKPLSGLKRDRSTVPPDGD